MTPTNLKTAAKKPLTDQQITRILNAVTTLYTAIYHELGTVRGTIEIPTPPEAPRFFQFKKWPPFFAELTAYIAKWKRISEALVTFIREIQDIFK